MHTTDGEERRRHREIVEYNRIQNCNNSGGIACLYGVSSTHYNFSTSFHSIFAIEYFSIGKYTTQQAQAAFHSKTSNANMLQSSVSWPEKVKKKENK